jgi:hypothetical protein
MTQLSQVSKARPGRGDVCMTQGLLRQVARSFWLVNDGGRIDTLSICNISAASANIPSPHLRAEKAPLEQSRQFPCCNLTRKRKRTRPCNDCPTSSLYKMLGVTQSVVCSLWTAHCGTSNSLNVNENDVRYQNRSTLRL